MRVNYLGHACFLLADNKFSVIIDPFKEIGYELNFPRADFCICSHLHFDHCATENVIVKQIITKDNLSLFPQIRFIDSFHDEAFGSKRGLNYISIIDIGGFKVCHMGDLGEPFNEELVEKIGKIDLLLIPIGGNYTIDAKEAFKYVKAIGVKSVIPMHYKTSRSKIDIAEKKEFLQYFDNVSKVKSEFDFLLPNELTVYDVDDCNF